MKKNKFILGALILFPLLNACQKLPSRPDSGRNGAVAGNDATAGNPDGSMSTAVYTGLTCDSRDTHRGIRAWRRLSNIELKNTVAAVFGVTDGLNTSAFIGDVLKSSIFDTSMVSDNYVSTDRMKGYITFAESLGAKVDIAKIFPCLAKSSACIASTLPTLGASAWRRPLASEEVTALVSVYDKLLADGYKDDAAARLLVQALVLSQGFLYRSELGEKLSDGTYELTDWELASALSYTILRTVPDAELKTLAAAKQLRNSDVLLKQAERLLALPQAKIAWKDFGRQWLQGDDIMGIEKAETNFSNAVKVKASEEIENFFVDTMFSATRKTFDQLLLADYTIGDSSTSFIYGGTVANGKITYKEPQRRGLLGQAGFLAASVAGDTTNPIKRGVFILSRLMCNGFVPAPPTEFPEKKEGMTTKELLAAHTVAECAGCHKHIDDFGLALENFDTVGKYRDTEAGEAIVIKGLVKIDGKDLSIGSPLELSEAIAHSQQGPECFARQTFRYALGRNEYASKPIVGGTQAENLSVESQLDSCQIQAMTSSMSEKGGDLKSALLDLVSNPAFRLRLAGPAQ